MYLTAYKLIFPSLKKEKMKAKTMQLCLRSCLCTKLHITRESDYSNSDALLITYPYSSLF